MEEWKNVFRVFPLTSELSEKDRKSGELDDDEVEEEERKADGEMEEKYDCGASRSVDAREDLMYVWV